MPTIFDSSCTSISEIILLTMKIRAQRVHHMGSSNRDNDIIPFNTKSVFQNSYIKSKSSYYQTAQSLPPAQEIQESKTSQPFKGYHNELLSARWNSQAKKAGKEAKWNLKAPIAPLDHSGHLNEEVLDIAEQFKGREVNLFKLNQLKRTFIKNNRNRRYLREYFGRFAKEGRVGVEQLQSIVGEYGYDINEDQAKLIFRLSGANSNLNLNQFIELMSRDNVHFSTLKIEGATQPRQHFQQKIHVVIKNKFNQLNEAFKIYRSREQPIDQQKFDYVMKKLDINDLVISQADRQQLFERYKNKHGYFNAEALFSAIIEQDQIKRPVFPPKLSDFETNLKVNEQEKAKKQKKATYFDLKKAGNLQFEAQMAKAQQVLRQIKKLGQQGENLITKKGGVLDRQQFMKQTENLLREKGINFTKEQYDCFASYFDYNNAQQITDTQFKHFLNQTRVKAQQRLDRRHRVPAPLQKSNSDAGCDQKQALLSLNRLRNVKFDPQTKNVFNQFDKDKDGYLSRSELKQNIHRFNVLENWQVQNLINYFDQKGKGYVNYADFAKKFDDTAAQTDLNFDREPLSKLKSHSDWLSTKKNHIKANNTYIWNAPTKYSAWPERLRQTDLSLVQPPARAGQFISQHDRFNSTEKHNIGQQLKQEKLRMYENKLRKLVGWNQLNEQRVNAKQQQFQKRSQANDYSLRLTKQVYEQRCHNPL